MKKPAKSRRISKNIALSMIVASLWPVGPALASAEYQRHYDLGKDFLQRQEYKLAIQELTLAADKQASPSELAVALVDRGTAYSELGNYKAALSDFDRAIALDGKAHLAFNNRGVVYFRQGIADKAISNFDQALALDPTDKYAVVNRAGSYLLTDQAAGLAPKTEAWLRDQKWKSDFSAHAAVLTALAYLSGGDKASAQKLTTEALKKLDRLHWPYPMLSYLAGKVTPEKVVEASADSTYDLTQAQCFLGVDAFIKGKANYDVAREKLGFVTKHGTTNSVEYWVAKAFLKRIKGPAAPAKTGH
ncbi:MAG: tetratricopeptide repeat protein [Cyanobacteria bacterium SZAS LIN-2]|nr:tetratricopeptide repeat protein [Cyanobacteria bacterium SZAS LIN-2]